MALLLLMFPFIFEYIQLKPIEVKKIEIKKVEKIIKHTIPHDNDNELICLAKNIYFEARNQSLKGQYAVGFVTMNRVKSQLYPNTICEVVYQPYQFSWTIDLKYEKPKNKKAWKTALIIASNIINNNKKDDITFGAMHYHADYVNPKWNKKFTKVSQIENHIFYN